MEQKRLMHKTFGTRLKGPFKDMVNWKEGTYPTGYLHK